MFLPTTKIEMTRLGWSRLDVVLITGDSYIDSPYVGVSLIGHVLAASGYRVGIIAQPDIQDGQDISRLGEPRLFWGVTGGSVDSMVANYTATGKRRKKDDFTPGGLNTRRPDRAVIVYTNLIRQYFKNTCPIVLGGIEAGLRRVSHYDFWSNTIRRSILFDAKADFLVYGMGEQTVIGLAQRLDSGRSPQDLPGLCYISSKKIDGFLELPSHDTVSRSKPAFTDMFHEFYRQTDPKGATGLFQRQDTRYLVQNPPPPALHQDQLDKLYEMGFEHTLHPSYSALGVVKGLETIRFSITTHRGCYGQCHFCAIGVHQGTTVQWRSETSILREAKRLSQLPDFKGIIQDVGGPTANMYGFECTIKRKRGICRHRNCLVPEICPHLKPDHSQFTKLLMKMRQLPEIKKIFIRSGLRHDLVLADQSHGMSWLDGVVRNHVSGQLKVAPEHSNCNLLKLMGKPDIESLLEFKAHFDRLSTNAGKKQFLTYYFIAAHPGCSQHDMVQLKQFTDHRLRMTPEQVQIFTPTPATYSSLMYYTGKDPFTGRKIFVETDRRGKEKQKKILTQKTLLRRHDNRRHGS
ncbi:MAG: YgiQ family radical SAM protein [Deltaproteobacteria bacterium]|nr:YgiQ family radical SAM protein [Deltaproteobacteria bacterium]